MADNIEEFDEFGNPIEGGSIDSLPPSIKKRARKDKTTGDKTKIDLSGKTLQDILGLSNKFIKPDLSKFSIDSIPIEHSMVESITDVSPILKQTIQKGDDIIKTYPELSDDIFLSLYKAYPELLSNDEMNSSYQLNRNMMDSLTEDPQYTVLKDYCQLDQFSLAIASLSLHDNAIQKLEELKEELQGAGDNIIDSINEAIASQQDLDDLMQKAQALQQLNQQIQQATGKTNPQLDELANQMKMDLAQAMKIANERSKTFHKVMQKQPGQMKKIEQALSSGLDMTVNAVVESNDLVSAWGFEPGDETRVSIDSKIQAIQIIRRSPDLKKLTDIIGALKEQARAAQKSKTKNGTTNIQSVTVGNNLQIVLPSEKMLLNNPTTRTEFYRKYFSKQLLTYEVSNIEKKGRGPMIVCVDDSGSMGDQEQTWSRAFAMALLEIAQLQKRNYALILYDDYVRDVMIQEKGYLDPLAVVEICEKRYGGGTNFERPLKKSLELLNDNRFKHGDIVFITDGDCCVSDSFMKTYKQAKESKEFFTRGILINIGSYRRSSSEASLKMFCDEVIPLTKMVDLSAEGVLAQSIFKDV